jgi:hypothetical protein
VRKKLLVSSVVAAGVAFVFAASPALAGDAWIGTWKLNAEKSKASTGGIRAQTLKFESTADGIKLSAEGTDAQGNAMTTGYTSKFDGKDVPWPGNPVADTAAPKRVDDKTYENVWKKGGKAVATAKVAVSADGKTLTVTQSGTDAEGKAFTSVAVYDRQ